VERKGKLEEEDRDLFIAAAIDFYAHQVSNVILPTMWKLWFHKVKSGNRKEIGENRNFHIVSIDSASTPVLVWGSCTVFQSRCLFQYKYNTDCFFFGNYAHWEQHLANDVI